MPTNQNPDQERDRNRHTQNPPPTDPNQSRIASGPWTIRVAAKVTSSRRNCPGTKRIRIRASDRRATHSRRSARPAVQDSEQSEDR